MKKILYIITGVFALIGIFIICCYFFVPICSLKDREIIYVTANKKYKTKSINVKYRGKEVKTLNVKDNTDVTKIGTYTIQYDILIKNKVKRTIKRKVKVIDNLAPEIVLIGEKELLIDYGSNYNEPGYTAIDNYDGDVTEIVKVMNNINTFAIGEQIIKYEATDKAGNKKQISRKIIVKDISAPKIEISRAKDSFVILENSIDVNVVNAIDNYDGDISNKVKVEGIVDLKKEGKYKVTYSVSDTSGNESVLETTINVQSKNTKGVPILMYHFFYDDTKGQKGGNSNFISKSSFESQINYLIKNNYYFPTWQELEDYIDGKIDLPKKSIILTADDGNTTFYKIALPICQKNHIPITSFVVAIRKGWEVYKNQEYLNIESHTYDMHRIACKGLDYNAQIMCSTYNEIYTDMYKSIQLIGSKNVLAYPFGHYNNEAIKSLKSVGIKMAVTTEKGYVKKGSNKYKLPRIKISNNESLSKFIKKL